MFSRKLTMLSSRSFVVILVTTFPAFQPQGACEARVLINSLPWRERRKPATEYSKSWLEIPDKSRAWREILTRNSESKEETECAHSPLLEILTRNRTRNTNSRSALKIGQPSCAWYIFTKLYLVSILHVNRWINKVINTKLLVSSVVRPPHLQTISSAKESPSRIIYLYTNQKEKSLKENS